MNISSTTIVNAALRLIGAKSIQNIDDASDRSREAKEARFFYPLVREAVFRAHTWNCISVQATLTEPGPAPQFGYSNSLVLPGDYVRFVGMDHAGRDYKIQNDRLLYYNDSTALIEYVKRETDCTQYSGDLVRALYMNLAYELAFAVAQNEKIADRIRTDLEKFFLPIARMNDAYEQGRTVLRQTTLTDMFL